MVPGRPFPVLRVVRCIFLVLTRVPCVPCGGVRRPSDLLALGVFVSWGAQCTGVLILLFVYMCVEVSAPRDGREGGKCEAEAKYPLHLPAMRCDAMPDATSTSLVFGEKHKRKRVHYPKISQYQE